VRYEKGTRVVVSRLIRRGDDADTLDFDGWVMFHGEGVIIIADAEDYATCDPEKFTVLTFHLDEVIVSEYTPPLAVERGSSQALFLVRACAVFLMILGALGASWFWFSIGLCVFAAPLIIRAAHAADTRKANRS
jgi:hypothetical protein